MIREPAWRTQGEEPDYRFTLANERTFLAWVRTALAILAAGVLLDQFSNKLRPHDVVVLVAAMMCVLAGALCFLSYFRWRRNEIAMRHKERLPPSTVPTIVAVGVFAAAAILALLIGLAQWLG
jgi:putative membrane protein